VEFILKIDDPKIKMCNSAKRKKCQQDVPIWRRHIEVISNVVLNFGVVFYSEFFVVLHIILIYLYLSRSLYLILVNIVGTT